MEIKPGKALTGIKVSRAAVLPFAISGNGIIYFLLAKHKKTGEITDLGGGVKKNECALAACLREFKEETNEIFGKFYDNYNNFSMDLAVIDLKSSMSVLFVPLTINQCKKTIEMFKDANALKPNEEISDLIWVNEKMFGDLITCKSRQKMWIKLRNFYHDFYGPKVLSMLRANNKKSLLVKMTCSQ